MAALAATLNAINVTTRKQNSLGLGEENFEKVIVALFLLFANQRQVSGYAAERALGEAPSGESPSLRCCAHGIAGSLWTAEPALSPGALLKLRLQTLAVNSQKVATCSTTYVGINVSSSCWRFCSERLRVDSLFQRFRKTHSKRPI